MSAVSNGGTAAKQRRAYPVGFRQQLIASGLGLACVVAAVGPLAASVPFVAGAGPFQPEQWCRDGALDPGSLVDACTVVIDVQGQIPAASWAFNNRANGYLALGQLDLAISDYSTAIELDGSNEAAFANRARAYAAGGEYDLALADYDSAIDLSPEVASFYNGRGIVLVDLGELDRAVEDFDKAITLDSEPIEALQNRGNAYQMMGNNELAEADFEAGLAIAPGDPSLLNSLAWTLYLEGRPDEALAYGEEAAATLPEPFVLDTLAHILAAVGRQDDAFAAYRDAMERGGLGQILLYQSALVDHGYLPAEGMSGEVDDQTLAALTACLEDACRLVE